MRVLVASRNKKKLAELNRMLEAANVTGVELVGLGDVPEYPETPETGATFADNARIKTNDGVRHAGLPTIADDSGLAIEELNGMPGVLQVELSALIGLLGNYPTRKMLTGMGASWASATDDEIAQALETMRLNPLPAPV